MPPGDESSADVPIPLASSIPTPSSQTFGEDGIVILI